MISKTAKISSAIRQNTASARALWPGECSRSTLNALRELTTRFTFSIRLSEIRLLDGAWYVTNSGLIRLAERRRCRGINSQPIRWNVVGSSEPRYTSRPDRKALSAMVTLTLPTRLP